MKHNPATRRFSAVLAALLLLPTLLTACRQDPTAPPDDGTTPPATQADTKTETDPETSVESETDPGSDETKPPEDTTVQLTGPYAESIMYADAMKNEVQVYFADQLTRDVAVENTQMKMLLGTLTDGQKKVISLQNKQGGTYLSNTMDIYIRTADGRTLYAADSPSAGRLNIYRYGYYYYNAHILDQIFAEAEYLKETDLKANTFARRADTSDVVFVDAEEGCAFRVESTRDPYIGLNSLKYDSAQYNAVEIIMRAEKATTADLFLGVGKQHLWPNSDQCIAFSVSPGENFCTYVIPISGVMDYEGNINAIRLDIGAAVGELVEVKSMRLIQMDSTIPAVSLDRTLHTYADKLTQETHLVTTAPTANLSAYGMKTEIAADRVTAIVAKDKNGTHTAVDGVDFATLEYIGFAVKDAGVFGYIKPVEYGGSVTVTLKDGTYTILQEVALKAGESLPADTHLYMATGIYTDTSANFDAFLYAAACERDPLEITITNDRDGGAFVGYDALRGAYRLDINGSVGFQYNYENDIRRTLSFKVAGENTDRKVYIYTYAATGETLEAAVLLDENNRLLPIPVEVCKNFGHEKEEPVFVPTDARWGETYFPFVVEAGKDNVLSVVNLYQDWGQFPLKQVSSISFNAPYYHLSTGATESNCIANYFIAFMAANLLPDFRPMSQRFWTTQPQHTAGGVLNFLSYVDDAGKYSAMRHTEDEILCDGPVYADIEMNFASHDNKLAITLDHIEMPQTDENRTYYTYTVRVLEDLSVKDFKNDFTLFTMSSTNTNYKKLGYLDENNKPAVVDTSTTDAIRYITLGKESPYVDLFVGNPAVHEDGYTNLAALIRSYAITVGGKAYEGNIILRESMMGGKNYTELSLDLGAVTLKAGDTMTFEMILMPWGEGQDTGISETDDIVRRVRMDSCIDPFKIVASVGTVVDHPYIPMLTAKDGTAEFTVSGGHDTAVFYTGLRENKNKVRGVAVRVFGFDRIGVPVVEEYVGGKWVKVRLASDYYAYDGYSVRYEGDGTYSYTFAIDMTEPDARKFRVTLDTNEKIFADIDPTVPGSAPNDPTESDVPVIDGIKYTTACVNSLSAMAFDTLIKDTAGTMYQPEQGNATAFLIANPITLDESWNCFRIKGWAGYDKGNIVAYGYRINDGELVTDEAFVQYAEEGVVNAGGQSRFDITAPIADTTKATLFRAYIILEDGTAVEMIRFWALGSGEA